MFYSLVTVLLATAVTAAKNDYSLNGVNWEGTCATGTHQSPIDLTHATETKNL